MGKQSNQSIWKAENILRRLLLSWLAAANIGYFLLPGKYKTLQTLDGIAMMSLPMLLGIFSISFLLLMLIGQRKNTAAFERWFLVSCFAVLSGTSLIYTFTWPFFFCCLLIVGIFSVYALNGWKSKGTPPPIADKSPIGLFLVSAAAVGFISFVSAWTVCRVLSFCTPSYDFGIFSQMFHSMAKSGLPITTLERDGMLSHFYVHVSPIYYLILPIYFVFPFPATLQILQAVILASAVIPLWKLCRLNGLSWGITVSICCLLLLYPAYSGGTSYDLHENAFLTPFILWLLYAMDQKKLWMMGLFSLLTLCVKEDAAVYVAIAALFLLIRSLLDAQNQRWGLITGAVLLSFSVGWFLAVTSFLQNVGDGVMTYRYQNFMFDGSDSLISVIKTVILCPMKAIFESVDKEKLSFLFYTMFPLLGMPLLTRRYERYILLIPYVLINLMSDYQYQHDIFFQYTFGSTAFLFYLTAVNLGDWKEKYTQILAGCGALAIALSCFLSTVVPKASLYTDLYRQNKERYREMAQTLSLIPENASVSASTFYTTFLSKRDILFDVKYASFEHVLDSEYIALAVNSQTSYTQYATNGEDGFSNLIALLEDEGYKLYAQLPGTLVIYQKT